MTTHTDEILKRLAQTVVNMDEEGAVAAAHRAIEQGVHAYIAITEGLSRGMLEVGNLYDRGVYFVPEILICSDAMTSAIEVLKPHIRAAPERKPVTVILGVVEGDIHDIGKNIVKIMLEAAGFEVRDLGRDVPAEAFVAAAREAGSGIVGLSTLMSTTMKNMGKTIQALTEAGLRDKFGVMIGGCPASAAFAKQIGADGYGQNAQEAIALAERLAAGTLSNEPVSRPD
jgi:dimethylamine corrinoid protein